MSIVDEVKRNASNEQNARNAFALMSMNRRARRAVRVVNGTAKIPGLQRPFVKEVKSVDK